MRAAVLYEAQTPMLIEDVSLEGPKDDEVLVQVKATGACHSDYHVIDGSWHGAGYPMPVILGHEAAGIVERVGANVASVKPGDHVILSFAPNCGRCRMCTIGQPHLCSGMRSAPGTFPDGTRRHRKADLEINSFGRGMSSFAEYSVVHQSAAIKINPEMPMDGAALPAGSVQFAGIAFAGDRRIGGIELSWDGGRSWHAGELQAEFSPYAWRFWQLSASLPAGHYNVSVRARDGEGTLQSSSRAPTKISSALVTPSSAISFLMP